MLNGGTGNGATDAVSRMNAERETLLGHRKAANEELQTAVGQAQWELRREIKQIDDRIRALNIRLFDAQKKIKRGIGGREVCCPSCDRWLPAGTVISDLVIEKLKAAGFGGLLDSMSDDSDTTEG